VIKNDPDVVKTEDDMKKIAAKKHCKIIKAYDKDGNLVKEYQGRKEFEKIEHADIRSVKATNFSRYRLERPLLGNKLTE